MSRELLKPKLLIGEGKEEVRFFEALLCHLQLDDIQVEEYAGKAKLKDYVGALRNRPNFSSLATLAITRDADTDPAAAFDSVCHALQEAGLPVPRTPDEPAPGPPAICVFIFPGAGKTGTLEDVCLCSASSENGFECVDSYFECLRQAGRTDPGNMSKARVHAWLACQKEPDLRLGEAAEKKYWDWDHSAFEPIKRFIQML